MARAWIVGWTLVAFLAVSAAGHAWAAKDRVALVIGNGAYHVGPLKNPPSDAALMARTLRGLGFSVSDYKNLNHAGLNRAIDRFGESLKSAEVGLFYYAGHGAQFRGENYMIPVGVDIRKANELPYRAVPVGLVLAKMEGEGNPVNLVFLDACRNNPFARSWRSSARGLAKVVAPRGTQILYATRPNMEATDGDGDNSPFTESLARNMARPGVELGRVIRSVVRDVEKATDEEQSPWPEGIILSDFYFSEEEEKPGPGRLNIVLQPEVDGAWVRINGRDYGERRQFTINSRGDYRIEVGAEGYRTHRASENLGPGVAKTVTARLEREARVEATPEPAPVPAPVPVPAVSQGRRAGDILRGPLGMEFAWIPAGSFMMGSPEDEPERYDDEKRHRVTLTEGFWLQTTETTQGQWKAVMGNNPSHFKNCGDDCPVEKVSWNDVQGFIKKLNARGEGTYRLPTEAQWEYAARAGTDTPFYFGDCLSTDQANYNGNYPLAGCSKGRYRETTIPGGSLNAPNAWGLHDMHGNVWEWVADWYGDYPSGSVTDPTGPRAGSYRVERGGSWFYYAADCRSAFRGSNSPGARGSNLGFRLSRQP